jgi:hypothetical protein
MYRINYSRNPDAIPVKTGNQNTEELDARLKTSGMTDKIKAWIRGKVADVIFLLRRDAGSFLKMRSFAESTLRRKTRFLASLGMTSEGLRMTVLRIYL